MKQYTNRTRPNQKAEQGITLFELLIVLAIIAFLATLVAPRVVGYLGRAKSDVAAAQLSNIAASLELFYLDLGRYPTSQEGLTSLVNPPPSELNWQGPYLKDLSGLVDPWGRDFLYTPSLDSETFEVSTLGKDGEEGGEGENRDIRKK